MKLETIKKNINQLGDAIESQSFNLLSKQLQVYLVILMVVIICWNFLYFLYTPIQARYIDKDNQKIDYIVLEKGENTLDLAEKLADKNYITNPLFFNLYSYLSGHYKSLQAGQYPLIKHSDVRSLIRDITNGKVMVHYFAIIAGEDFSDILENQKTTSLVYDSNTDKWLDNLNQPNQSETNYNLYLIADSFAYQYQDNLSVVLKASNQKLTQTIKKLKEQHQTNWVNSKSDDEIIVIASLLEKESSDFEDKRKIAGVIKNRLEKSMKLQIDASAIFAHKNQGRNITKPSRADLKIDSEYNTYTNFGLPKSAIAIVSEESLKAAFDPVIHSYLFYVAINQPKNLNQLEQTKQVGLHYFSESYDQHLKFIQTKKKLKN